MKTILYKLVFYSSILFVIYQSDSVLWRKNCNRFATGKDVIFEKIENINN
jgi:hypothetical protein